MKFRFEKILAVIICSITAVFLTGCVEQNMTNGNQSVSKNATTNMNTSTANSNSTNSSSEQSSNLPVTLPILDAMFVDESFAAELKSKLNLTDEQIAKLKQTAREATANLKESDESSTAQARQRYEEQVKAIVGNDKMDSLTALVRERWAQGTTTNGETNTQPTEVKMTDKPNGVPSDTRIVVNAPAYRMDVFKDGQLVRSYKVGIGYPEFPLPTGMRKASSIIFNPTWTPPDEPWVEGSKKVKAGQKVEAGSSLNPLGPIKIPIGLPSLIHGGKSTARLGTFASHGCVGLTNLQVQDFAMALAQISGTQMSDDDVSKYEKAKTKTENVKLAQVVPVELRYETIVVEDGKLHIYRDVYERGTNTEENLRKVLETYGVSLDSLSEQERTKALDALKKMAVDAQGTAVKESAANTNSNVKSKKPQSGKVTRNIKGEKEIVIEVAALKGKGYPAPVDLNAGVRSKKPLNLGGNSNTTSNAMSNSNSNQTTDKKEKAAGKK